MFLPLRFRLKSENQVLVQTQKILIASILHANFSTCYASSHTPTNKTCQIKNCQRKLACVK